MKTPTLLVLILLLLFPNKLYATYFKHLDELSHKREPFLGSEINMIREDSAGNIFLKAEGALIRYDIKKETFHQIRPAKVRAIASWVGSYYGGVSYFNLFDSQRMRSICCRKWPNIHWWCNITPMEYRKGETNAHAKEK